ncbi:MAG: DUF4097 domain-containing protein [Candidatus Velthaea sp.]
MTPNRRLTIVAALLVVEFALVGAMFNALGRGGPGTAGGHWRGMRPFGIGSRAMAAEPAQHLDRSFETGPSPHVYIDDATAEVTVTAQAGSTSVHVAEQTFRTGYVDESSNLRIERTGDAVRIERQPHAHHIFMFGSFRRLLSVTAPSGARVEVAAAATTHVSGLRERVSLHSRNGALTIADQRGDVTASTSNGRIELHDVTAPNLQLTTRNGRIELDRVRSANVNVATRNGRIEAAASTIGGGNIETRNGRIEMVLARNSNLTVSAQSRRGKVHFASHPAGSSSDDESGTGRSRTVRFGNGAGRLDVATGNGPISISIEGV